MAKSSKNGAPTALQMLAPLTDRLSSKEMGVIRRRIDRMSGFLVEAVKDQLSLHINSLVDFRARWLCDTKDPTNVMRKCRQLVDERQNDFCDFFVRIKRQFFNAGFEIYTSTKKEKTKKFQEKAASYPFAALARDVWNEWLTCSNVVAFWRTADKVPAEQLIDGLPLVTILNCEDVDYRNEFGVERVKIKLTPRKLSAKENKELGPRYAKALEEGGWLELDREEGENWRVLTTAKLGNGFGMPRFKAVFDDLSARELLKIGDWNGAWARKKLMRQMKKGHEIKDGPLAGMPEHFYTAKFGKALFKALQGQTGFIEMLTNFDMIFEYVFLNPDFFDPKIYKSIEERLYRWGGAAFLMLREGNPNPNLTKVFQAEGLSEREIIGPFIEGILNDPTFIGKTPRGMETLRVRWDEWIFFNQAELRQMITFGLQNGILPPQLAQRALRIDTEEHLELMQEAIDKRELWTPAFEAKQGMAAGEAGLAGGGNNGGDAGATGGRPASSGR